MSKFQTRFGQRIVRATGALELMEDLGAATASASGSAMHMLGGGNPARIPGVEAVYQRRLAEIAADTNQFGRFAAHYSAPAGDLGFRCAVAEALEREYGWNVTARNVALTAGSQTAFFFLFNLFAGATPGGATLRVLLPLAPEYIGYADLGLTPGMLCARPALIEHLPDGFFKYHVDFANLTVPPDIGAICVSRPTNPSGNVLTMAELERLDALARVHDVPLIIDAAYGTPFPGIQHAHHELLWNDNIVLCLSLSKLGLPGTRTGIVVASEDIIEALTACNATTALAPASTGAVIVEPLLRSGELLRLCNEVIRPYYAQRRDQAVTWLREACAGLPLQIHQPEGAFFLWLWIPGLPIASAELYRRLKARGVLVLSGHYFFPGLEQPSVHTQECLRMNYSQPPENVHAGIIAIAAEIRRAFAAG
jgi:valine--pyruvate aminotransferase